jgi:hypothetical protein
MPGAGSGTGATLGGKLKVFLGNQSYLVSEHNLASSPALLVPGHRLHQGLIATTRVHLRLEPELPETDWEGGHGKITRNQFRLPTLFSSRLPGAIVLPPDHN